MLLNIECLIFSTTLTETFLVLRIRADITTNVRRSLCTSKMPDILIRF